MINAITTARGQLSRKGSVVPTNDIEAEMAQAPERVANGNPKLTYCGGRRSQTREGRVRRTESCSALLFVPRPAAKGVIAQQRRASCCTGGRSGSTISTNRQECHGQYSE